jgi:hypothetical protein
MAKLTAVDLAVKDLPRFGEGRARVEVTLHNMGNRRVVIDRADVEVRDVYELRRCASQDDIPISRSYGLPLPIEAKTGDVFSAPLHQQVGPDEADRFSIAMSTKPPANNPASLFLFKIDLSLQTNAPKPGLPLGDAVIGLPELPSAGRYYWTAETPQILERFLIGSPSYIGELRRFSMPCWRANTAALRQAAAVSAVRSQSLKEILAEVIAPNLQALKRR